MTQGSPATLPFRHVTERPARPHLPNAPIFEAALDIHVALPAGARLQQLDGVQRFIRDRYPTKRTRRRIEGMLDIKTEGEVRVTPPAATEDGYIFLSRDGKQVVQARLDGFTFSRLSPYGNWTAFRDEAKEHWSRYRTTPTSTTSSS